jgi:hypothetical protein
LASHKSWPYEMTRNNFFICNPPFSEGLRGKNF